MSEYRVILVGRPNVGKSSLFNALAGKRLAIVHDTPGVTRDLQDAEMTVQGQALTLVDSAGLEELFDDSLTARMRRHTEKALVDADLVLLVIDADAGVTALDEHFANWLRRQNIPVRVLANKIDRKAAQAGLTEAWRLGLGEPWPVSAEHRQGLRELRNFLAEEAAKKVPEPVEEPEENTEATFDLEDDTDEQPKGPLQLVILGRPNVGKSTLTNALLREERQLTGPEAGITRDAIRIPWSWKDRAIDLIDTAGMRRRTRVQDSLEKMSVGDSLESLQYAEMAILVLDATQIPLQGCDKQDLTIAGRILSEGRALVIALNKWDIADDKNRILEEVSWQMQQALAQIKDVPIVPISAEKGRGIPQLMKTVLQVEENWNRRLTTGALNRWLESMQEAHAPPLINGRRLKIRYMTQPKARPPTFALFCNMSTRHVPDAYQRYLMNGLREAFQFEGVPLRLQFRQGKNPFTD